MRDLDKPLVVIEDEHGFKSMYWYLEPTSEDNVSHNKKRQPPARYMASFWLLVTNKAKQNEEQDDYRFRGGGTGEEIAEIWHTQNATQVGLASDKVEKAACENRNYRKAARSKPQGKNRQAITQPTYEQNLRYLRANVQRRRLVGGQNNKRANRTLPNNNIRKRIDTENVEYEKRENNPT